LKPGSDYDQFFGTNRFFQTGITEEFLSEISPRKYADPPSALYLRAKEKRLLTIGNLISRGRINRIRC